MRVTALILLALCFLIGSPGRAAAEKVKTNQTTKVYARPGEQAKVLLSVKSGQNMTLLARDGRWLKVRVQGRTGYVPRSKVDMADEDDIARNTRRRPFVDGRSRHRGFGGDAPDDRVGADATGEGGDGKGEDDEEDEAPKKPSKAVKTTKGHDEDEDDEDEDEAKKPTKAAKVTKGKGEDEEEEDEKPAKKPPAKIEKIEKTAKPAVVEKKPPPKKEEDEEDEEDESPKKPAGKGGDEEDEEESSAKKAPAKGGDEEESGDDEKADNRPRARVAKKVSVYEKPNAESNEEFVVRPTDILYPSDEKNGWTFVENDEGDGGWIQSTELEMDGGGGPGGSGKKQIDLRARAGLKFIQQGMRTQGSTNPTVPDNYNIGTSTVTLSIGGGILVPKGKLLLGGEFTYDYAKTLLGGISYDPDGQGGAAPVSIGLTIHDVNVRGLIGKQLGKKMVLFGRLGYRYQGYLITDVASMTANPAKLPSEVVKAPTIGAALAIPKLTDQIGMRFALDAILFASSVKQTVGLEDGTSPSAKAVVVDATVTYHWKKAFDLQAAYDLEYMGMSFGGPLPSSTRGHMGTSITRTDLFHMVSFGIAKPF